MKTILRHTAILLATGVTMLAACKKEDGNNSGKPAAGAKDTAYVVTSIHRNGVILDSLVYDTNTLLLKTIISPTADGTSIFSRLEFTYNKDNKVQRIAHYNAEGQQYQTDSLSWNSNGFAVFTSLQGTPYADSTQYALNTDGQATQVGSKDTLVSQLDGEHTMVYSTVQLAAQNTATVENFTYYGTPQQSYTTSYHKTVLTYDTGLNPFFHLYRNCPFLVDYWQPQLDYAFDAMNNPATATYTEQSYASATDVHASSNDHTDFTYVYDSISHYPLQ
ncbi:MAG TPA: hypothetical protein VGC22_06575, partial [Chitinophaga sp.]